MRAGRKSIDFTKASAASTVIPIRRKGMDKIQMMGVSRRMKMARGQQMTANIAQSMSVMRIFISYLHLKVYVLPKEGLRPLA
jgi:type IV secretory pathway TrbD component